MIKSTYPSLEDMAQNLALNADAIEVIYQPMYDYNIYPTAGIINLPFFQTALGAGQSSASGTAAGATKTLSDTNMQVGGSLPSPMAYFVRGFEIVCEPGSVATANTFTLQIPGFSSAAAAAAVQAGAHDVNAVLTTGAFQFTISQKPYYQEAPLYRFPPKSALRYDGAIAGTLAATSEVGKEKMYAIGDVCVLEPGVAIMTSQNFIVNLLWPVIVPTPSGFNSRLGCIMNGWQFRAA
jgi:hypothetical protein